METKILEFSKFIDHLNLGYELVIASRMIKGGYNEDDNSIFKFRKWANLGFAFIANTAFAVVTAV